MIFCGGGSGGVGAATAVASAAAGGGGGYDDYDGDDDVLMLKALSLALTSAVIRVLRNTFAVIRNGSITEESE